jgi:hypothetical protein
MNNKKMRIPTRKDKITSNNKGVENLDMKIMSL